MPLTSYNFKKGVDLPTWHWLNQFPSGNSQPGTDHCYDGVRYIYWAIQLGTATAGTNSTTQLFRFDTWTNAWMFIVTLTSGNTGLGIDFDPVRNVIWISSGNQATEWRYFNLNMTSITLAGLTTNPWTLSSAISVVLPAIPIAGASIFVSDELDIQQPLQTSTAKAGSTATNLVDTANEFHGGLVGCYVRFTAGALAGQARAITAVASAGSLTMAAFGGAPAAGDAYVIEVPGGAAGGNPIAATGGSTTTLVAGTPGWVTNIYRDADVVIVAGTGAGQRRRIASNDATTLTLAGATAGNARTGPFATAPDATSTFRIVPSTDFVYFQPGGTSTALYRADVAATTIVWSTLTAMPAAPGGGGHIVHARDMAPFSLVAMRGASTATFYRYDVGLATWATLTILWNGVVYTTGSAFARMPGRNRFFVHANGTQQVYILNLALGMLEPFTLLPYSPATSNDGQRARYIKTTDGVEWMYFLRAGGPEFWRIPLEWLGP